MDGIILINKEKDYTSNDVVQIIKKTVKEKVGHTGTLDPMATGVLPILIGKGTLLSKYLVNHDKTYTATVKLGIKTDTGDITGNIIQETDISKELFNKTSIEKVLKNIVGEQKQIPPMYSAIKVNGKKLYEYARNGKQIEIEPRIITIYSIELIKILPETKEIKFKVDCSKGTYIRTLCEKIAEELGTIGTMSELNRDKVGEFRIENSIDLKKMKEDFNNNSLNIISIEDFFENKNKIILSEKLIINFLNGVKMDQNEPDGVYNIYDSDKKYIGTGIVNKGILKRDIVI